MNQFWIDYKGNRNYGSLLNYLIKDFPKVYSYSDGEGLVFVYNFIDVVLRQFGEILGMGYDKECMEKNRQPGSEYTED